MGYSEPQLGQRESKYTVTHCRLYFLSALTLWEPLSTRHVVTHVFLSLSLSPSLSPPLSFSLYLGMKVHITCNALCGESALNRGQRLANWPSNNSAIRGYTFSLGPTFWKVLIKADIAMCAPTFWISWSQKLDCVRVLLILKYLRSAVFLDANIIMIPL